MQHLFAIGLGLGLGLGVGFELGVAAVWYRTIATFVPCMTLRHSLSAKVAPVFDNAVRYHLLQMIIHRLSWWGTFFNWLCIATRRMLRDIFKKGCIQGQNHHKSVRVNSSYRWRRISWTYSAHCIYNVEKCILYLIGGLLKVKFRQRTTKKRAQKFFPSAFLRRCSLHISNNIWISNLSVLKAGVQWL